MIDVHGGVQKSGNASFSPTPVTGAATVPDPLASLAEPSTSGLTNYGSESLSGNSSATIKPGIYSQITRLGKRHAHHEQRHLHHRRRRLLGLRQRQRHRLRA